MDPEDSKITLKSLLNNMKDDNPPDFIMPECFSILTILYEMIDLDIIQTCIFLILLPNKFYVEHVML
jgi:hypothetical protein